jgi:hypothetical protein
MNKKQLPTIGEAPLILLGLVVATAATFTAAALLRTVRIAMRLTGIDTPTSKAPVAH